MIDERGRFREEKNVHYGERVNLKRFHCIIMTSPTLFGPLFSKLPKITKV